MINPLIKEIIVEEIEQSKGQLIQLTSDLIRIPSVNPTLDSVNYHENVGGETKVNQFLLPILDKMGLVTDLWEEEKGRANLVGVMKGKSGGQSLILNGHVDTVSSGQVDGWTVSEPFSGAVIDGKIYGRGAVDMKGGIAAGVIAVNALLRAGIQSKGNIILEFVSGEEMMNTKIGTGSAIQRGYIADGAIVLEPTRSGDQPAIICASPGTLILNIRIRGKAAHTLLRNELVRAGGQGAQVAVSAIDKAMIIYNALLKLEEEWGQTKSHPAFSRPGSFTICPTTFAGGLNGLSFIPEECMLKYVIWHAPQETNEQVMNEITSQIERYAHTDPWLREHPPELDWNDWWWPPYDIPPNAPICEAAVAAYADLCGKKVRPTGFLGVTDASFLNLAGIPTITMGPGSTKLAHTANEHVEIDDLIYAAKLYALTIIEWCGA